jgi:hexosaminidase
MRKMIRYLVSLVFILNLITSEGFANSVWPAIIPAPVSVIPAEGELIIGVDGIQVFAPEATSEAGYFSEIVKNRFGINVSTTADNRGAMLSLLVNSSEIMSPEGYKLQVSKTGIIIEGHDLAGVFYGIQSLLQMMERGWSAGQIKLLSLLITDSPRFPWRAFMLDESRYFKGEQAVYRLLDEMASLKLNVFHWHLTDDQGWRIEIAKYPLLTAIGSERKDTQIGGWNSPERMGEPHKGFYTREQIKRILAYAKERHIMVVPEIEMPGHASAAIAAYPWLGSSSGEIEVPVTFGKHYAVFNVVDPRVKEFLQDVVSEVIELFDSEVIHIGGDEVRFDQWEANEMVKGYKEKMGFTSFMDVQIDFTNQMSRFIESKGRRMMGWNEILGKNLHADDKIQFTDPSQKIASNVIVHFWKGELDEMTQAAKDGYMLVNSYHSYTYLDYSYDVIPLEKAYGYDPLPDGLPEEYEKNIMGLGCQMWGEWIPTVADMEEKVFPRIAAYAEVGWSLPENKDYNDFLKRLSPVIQKWKLQGINVHSIH